MALRREPVFFIITLLVCALLGWRLADAWGNPVERVRWSRKDRDVPAVRVPDLKALPAVPPLTDAQKKRDLFAAPRDTRPLEKLQIGPDLPVPEADAFSLLLPPPSPAPGMALWHTWLRVPARIEKVDFTNPEAPADGEATASKPAEKAASAPGGAADATAQDTGKPARPDDAALERRYDRLVLKDGPAQWGKILNPRKYDLKDDEAIVFQIYDVTTDRPFAKALTYTRDRLLTPGYQLAKTIRNEIEIRKRKIVWMAGNETKMRDFALWCIEQGDDEPAGFVEAQRQLEKVLEFAPKDPANSLALGKLYEATFRYQDAWKLYKSMTDGEFRAHAPSWVARAELERRLHLVKDAQASLERAAQLEPNSYQPKLVLGEFYISQNHPELAIEPLQSAMRDEPSGVEMASTRARIRRRLGEAALATGQMDVAADAFERARKADETDGAATTGHAVVLWLRKQVPQALELLNTQIATRPTAAALVTRGSIRLQNRDYAGARQDFDAAVGLDPVRDVRPLSALAFLYFITDHRDDAMQYIDRALQNDPGDPYARYLRGRMRREAGDFEGAGEDLRQAAMAALGFVDPLVELGLLCAVQELYEPADRYYAKAMEFDPKNADVLALRGLNLLKSGQTRRAREAFAASVAIAKEHPVARIGLGISHYLDDNPSAMRMEFAAVRENRPENDKYRNFAVQTLRTIEIHERKEEMNEGFERNVLSGDWTEQRVQDVQMKIVNGEYRIEKQFEIKGTARLNYRKYRLSEFCSFEADIKIPATGGQPDDNKSDVIAYIRKEDPKPGNTTAVTFEVAVIKERKRADGTAPVKLRYRNGDESFVREILFMWPEDRAVHVKIEVNDDENRPLGRLWLDQQVVTRDWELKFPRSTASQIDIGVEADADSGLTASVSIDNVRIVRRNQ
jgi:tetratricopeptide (TPR) repeat protein